MRFLHALIELPLVEPSEAVRKAHDALLALQPEGATHAACELCPENTATKEVAKVGDADRTYTEVEHLALMADAVTRETADLTTAKGDLETKLSEVTARVDVLEAEKASLETKLSTTESELQSVKDGIEQAAAVEARKDERKEAVKAANGELPDAYFTAERVQAWAVMTDEAFQLVVDGLASIASASGATKETAAFKGGKSPESAKATTKSFLAARRGGAI